MPKSAMPRVAWGERAAFTPPASASPTSPCRSAVTAWCSATSEDAQATSSPSAGPSRPSAKAARPMPRLPLTIGRLMVAPRAVITSRYSVAPTPT